MLAEAEAISEPGRAESCGDAIQVRNDAGAATMLAALIHDLRNPISVISANAEMLMDAEHPCRQSTRLLTGIYRASRRVEQLSEDLISLFGGNREELQVCSLIDLVESATSEMANRATLQNVCVEISIPEPTYLYVAKRRMERVFSNLVINALDSMSGGGRLRISGEVIGTDILIEVSDTGSGVPDHVRHRLFRPFVTSGKENGLGLGLAVSRHTALDHGGDLWLLDEPGPGAVFALRLPLLRGRDVGEI